MIARLEQGLIIRKIEFLDREMRRQRLRRQIEKGRRNENTKNDREDDIEKESTLSERVARHFGDRFPALANRNKERRKVVHRAD